MKDRSFRVDQTGILAETATLLIITVTILFNIRTTTVHTAGPLNIQTKNRKTLLELIVVANVRKNIVWKSNILIIHLLGQTYVQTPHCLNVYRFKEAF